MEAQDLRYHNGQKWDEEYCVLCVKEGRGTNEMCIQSHTTLLTFMCTQGLWCLACLARPRVSGVTMTPNTKCTIFSARATQCM
jgi:hypothetical protein